MADKVKQEQTYSNDDIKRIAPGYRGKRENFNPQQKGKPTSKSFPRSRKNTREPPSSEVTPPTHLQSKPTPQKNESIISDAIFGVDVTVTEISPRQSFDANFSKLSSIANEIYDGYVPDVTQLDRKLVKPEMVYYATSMLHLKLIEIKAKQGNSALTSAEKDIRKAVSKLEFNIPQPLFAYLQEIGNYTDKMGKQTELHIPNLPTTVVQNFGGYPAAEITAATHNLFEEIPSLGIAGDVLMGVAQAAAQPIIDYRVAIPANSIFTSNLAGSSVNIGERRPEIRQRLEGFGITPQTFSEYVTGTRFNLKYIQSVSDIIGKFETYRIEKVCFENLGIEGGESITIMTRPTENTETQAWTDRTVQPSSAATSSTAQMGASYCFGFQLFKESATGTNLNQRHGNWSCITGTAAENSWVMSQAWADTRNERRNLPPGIGTERFRAIGIRQDLQLFNVVRRMIKTQR